MEEAEQSQASPQLTGPDENHAARWPAALIGALALCVGLIKTTGWVLAIPLLVQPFPAFGGMELITSVCILLSGAALLATKWRNCALAGHIRSWLGLAIFLLAAITLAEMITGRNLGLDNPALHAALLPNYPAPGRMPANSTLSFLLIGIALLFCGRGGRSHIFTRSLVVSTFLIGATGFIGFCLNLQYFYGWYTDAGLARMALPTTVVVMVLSLGIGLVPCSAELTDRGEKEEREGDELRGIFKASALVLLLTATATAVTSFALMQRRIFQLTSEKLSELAHTDRVLIEQTIESHSAVAAFAASGPSLSDSMRRWNVAAGSRGPTASAPPAIRQLAANLLAHGFTGVAFRGTKGQTLEVGTMAGQAGLSVAIHDGTAGELIWDHEYYLSTRIPIQDANGVTGEMLGQQPVPMIGRLGSDTATWGKTGTLSLCTKQDDLFLCFPQRGKPLPFSLHVTRDVAVADLPHHLSMKMRLHIPSLLLSGARSVRVIQPITMAFTGKPGTAIMLDYRSVPVMASYTPVHNGDLGLVLKMDTTEVYGPVRHAIQITLPLVVFLILVSLRIMQWRLKPLVSFLVRSREQVRQLAVHDFLTGLPNRQLLEDRVRMAMASSSRRGQPFALVLLDIDGFKQVNDTAGHSNGDLLLRITAQRLKASVRASDTVARLGGDEFVLILQTPTEEAVLQAAKNIQSAFETPVDLDNCALHVHLSIGVAFYPADGQTVETLMHNADLAMYSAKQSGGNRCQIFGRVAGDPTLPAILPATLTPVHA